MCPSVKWAGGHSSFSAPLNWNVPIFKLNLHFKVLRTAAVVLPLQWVSPEPHFAMMTHTKTHNVKTLPADAVFFLTFLKTKVI